MNRGNWTDKRCYYVSVVDGRRRALVAGPFAHQRQAASAVPVVRVAGESVDPWAHFYAWGTCKAPNGHHDGRLNSLVEFDTLPHRPRQWCARVPGGLGF